MIEVDVTTEQEWAEDRKRFGADGSDGSAAIADAGPLAREFVSLAAKLAGETSVRGVLQRVAEAARSAVHGADLVSVTLRAPGGFHTPVETDPLATELDEVQYRLNEGPCVQATLMEGLGMTYCSDLRDCPEFPGFGRAAVGMGVCSILAVGMFPHGGDAPRMGALNIYSHEVGGLDEQDRDIALVLAAHASTALAATMACTAADLEVAQLRQALSTRDIIGQAKGILMERRKISADEAFDLLRSASQALNMKLTKVAQTLVERRADI